VSRDISHILDGWDFEPDRISVRIIAGVDGREKIQLRLDLGLLQMEMDGRPDGQRPEGCESWLEYYSRRQSEQEAAHPDAAPHLLETEDCERLLREGIQYYHRYLSFWHLKRYELCARDTNRNLRLFKFVREYARHDRDKKQFDQWRPYVTMMHTRAVATPFVEMNDFEAALGAIDAGIRSIRQFLEEYGYADRAEQCVELVHLERWREEVFAQTPGGKSAGDESPPVDPVAELRERLEQAVQDERFEEAARLRDEIRRLGDMPFQPGLDDKL
jgi:hypothetical protein